MTLDYNTTDLIVSDYCENQVSLTPEHLQELLSAFIFCYQQGYISSAENTIHQSSIIKQLQLVIEALDNQISDQVQQVIHDPIFKALESSWRGLDFLIRSMPTQSDIQVKCLSFPKHMLKQDLLSVMEIEQSHLFKLMYEQEYGIAGGEPYGVMVADYFFTQSITDVELMQHLAQIGALCFCPIISAIEPSMFGISTWNELNKPRDLTQIFATEHYLKWRSFRNMEQSKFLTLTLPRILARLPYEQDNQSTMDYQLQESMIDQSSFCWMNAAYGLAQRIMQAQIKHGFATAIRGAEGGGKIEHLPCYNWLAENEWHTLGPTEIGITDRQEKELSGLGFLPLCHYKNTDYAVFFGGQSVHKIPNYSSFAANENAAISAKLPFLLASSRFAHYLKMIARDKIGSFMEVADCEAWLNQWLLQYINGNAQTQHELKAKYPLAAAKVSVEAIQGQPGHFNAVIWIRPWLQMEALTTSMRLVAKIPTVKH